MMVFGYSRVLSSVRRSIAGRVMLPGRVRRRRRCRDARKERSSSLGGGRLLLLGIQGRAGRECDGVEMIPLPRTHEVVRGGVAFTFGFQLGTTSGGLEGRALTPLGSSFPAKFGRGITSIGRSRFGSGLDAGRLRNVRGRARGIRSVLHCQMQRDGGDYGGGLDLSRVLSLRGFE